MPFSSRALSAAVLFLLAGVRHATEGTVTPYAGVSVSPPSAPSAAIRPNIVFVLLDDVRYDDLVDHPFTDFPHLRRLMREGASFSRVYTSAPLCSPSRAVFMTGQYPHRNGIVDNGERAEQSHRIVTFPKLLRDAGYHTGFFGKWHMGHEDDSPRPGFDRWVSFVGQGVYFDPELNIDGRVEKARGYMTDLLTTEATTFIEQAPRDKPFLVFMAQKAVHPEIHPKQVRTFPPAPGDHRLYATDTVAHAPNWRAPTTGKPALSRPVDHSDPRSPLGGLPDETVKDRLRMLAAVDRSLGALVRTLEARGVLDETMIVVTSDQGFFYGEFGLAQERRLAYEPSVHIPLIVRYPALAAPGSRPSSLLSNVDVAPTMLELGGAPIPSALDGRSFVQTFRNQSAVIRDELLIEYYSDREFPRIEKMGYKALRTGQYKYIRYDELDGMDELYDLRRDPHELRNLLPGGVSKEVLSALDARLDRQLTKPSSSRSSDLLYLWASSADSTGPDFLAVYDVQDDATAGQYGRLVTTLAVPGRGHRTHHTDHALAADRQLFANDFGSGESYIFDLSSPATPRLVKQFEDVGALMHPHSFWRLPNNNVLATFQMQHDAAGMAPGGLVEMTPRGEVVRSSSAALPGVDRRIRPYSAAILPGIDRVVVTTSDMDNRDTTNTLQFWRLSDLSLHHTISLPHGPRGDEGFRSAEPRVLQDGRTVLVSTFNCGLYLLDGIDSERPSARLVYSFPRKPGTSCAVPVVAGNYYLITVPAWSAVVSLDVSNPQQPREVSRVSFGPNDVPHWIGIEPNHQRVVITGYQAMKTRVLMARFDERTGMLTLDTRFRSPGSAEPGLRMEGVTWPHGGRSAAVPHGAVFSRP